LRRIDEYCDLANQVFSGVWGLLVI